MSTPINPLTKYHSYAYQHILIACDTTETAEKLSASNEFLDFTRTQDAERVNTSKHPYAKYDPYQINLDQGRTGHYSILINGIQDAEFIITKAHWYNTTVAKAGDNAGEKYATYNVGGELEINEPQGVRFMNVMSEVADRLGSDPGGLIFMLKTVFVGHRTATYEDDRFSDPITDIRPILFWIAGMTGSFDISGGSYNIEFAGLNHGVTKQDHIQYGADRIKIDISKNTDGCEANTLSGALCKLQSKITEIYNDYYNEVKETFESTTDDEGKPLNFQGRQVTYVIEAEEPLDSPRYVVDDFKDSAKNTAEKGKAGIIDLSASTTIEGAIIAIANRCSRVQEDLKSGDGTDTRRVRYIPKVATTIQSTDTEYKIIYKLRRVLETRDDLLSVLSNRNSDNPQELDKIIQQNLFTLDYMYTGKSTDIVDFDLKMEMGLALFQSLATTENLPTSAELMGDGVTSETATAKPVAVAQTKDGRIRPKTPVFLSTKLTKEAIKHSTSPGRAGSFQELLSRHAALENMEAVVKIHGNPGLLNTVNQPPSEIADGTNSTDTGAVVEQKKTANGNGNDPTHDPFPYWDRFPAIVKINIQMPSTFYGGASNTNDYGEQFWYDGFFYCYAVEQFFDEGTFTQALHMVSVPKNSPEERTQKSSVAEQEKQTATANQNNNQAGIGTGATNTAAAGSNVGNTPENKILTIHIDTSTATTKQYLDANSE